MESNAQLLDFLTKCPLFDGIEKAKIEKIIPSLEKVQVEAGQTLLSEESTPEGIYIVNWGKLVLIQKDKFIHYFSKNDHFGALYFLTDTPVKRYIKALRDSELFILPKEMFLELIKAESKVLQNITKTIASDVHNSFTVKKKKKRARIFALIPHKDEPSFVDFYEKIFDLFKEIEDTVILKEGDSKKLEEHDEENKTLLLICSHKMDEWTNLAIHNADKAITVASRKSKPDLSEVETKIKEMNFLDRHLILLYDGDEKIEGTKDWLKKREVRTHQHVFYQDPESINRIFRILSERSLAVVLSGGGAKGHAQLGFLLACIEKGIKIDIIGGTSAGAIMGGVYGCGWRKEEIIENGPSIFHTEGGVFDYTLPFVSALKGKRAVKKLKKYTKDLDIEDFKTTFFCASSNLTLKAPHMHTSGSLATALRASTSLPGIYSPVYIDHNVFVDGVLFNNLPIDMCKQYDPGKIIAVNVSTDNPRIEYKPFPPSISGWRKLFRLFMRKEMHIPSFFDVLALTTEISGRTYKQKLIKDHVADLQIDLPVEHIEMLDFKNYAEIQRIGYEYSKKNIDTWIKELGL